MFKQIFSFFSFYAHPFEKKAAVFLRKINSGVQKSEINKQLLALMQENTAIFNVYLEKKYRNYSYLSKKNRKKMYENLRIIENDFQKTLKGDENEQKYLEKIMVFLKKGQRFFYEESSSFGKLLQNPEKMIGDCNQIVSFYIHLFALKFPIEKLQIKITEGHVSLYFDGKDIEATAGAYGNYPKYLHLLPITEIISTNLLDISDYREWRGTVSMRDFLKASQLAYLLSSLREIVDKNLNVAFQKMGIELYKQGKYDNAFYFLEKAQGPEAEKNTITVAKNIAIKFLNQKNYKRAVFYAQKAGDSDLERQIRRSEAIGLIEKGSWDRARSIIGMISDQELAEYSYKKEYAVLMKDLQDIKTLEDAKKKKAKLQKLLAVAKKTGDSKLREWPEGILGKI